MSLFRGWAGCLALACLLSCVPLLLATAEESADKVAVLRKHTAKAGTDQIMQFTDKSFSRYAFEAADRPYHLVLLLSANNCPACSMLKKALTAVKVVADGLPERTPLFFAELNHDKNQKSFQSMGITHTPVLLFLPRQRPGEGVQPAQYPISTMDHLTSPDMVAKWLAHHSGLPVSMPQPLWKNAYVQNILIAVALFFFLYKLPTLLRNWNHPLVFFFGFMCVYAFTFSGVIYNAIHKLPWSGTNHHTGEVELFMSEMRAQYAGEGAIIAALNILACFFVILLADWVPKIGPYWVRVPLFGLFFGGALVMWLAQVRLFSAHKAPYYPFKL